MKYQEKEAISIREYIKHWEGFRSKPYRCPAGKLTIGYGRNIQDNPLTADEYRLIFPLYTLSEAMKLLYDGINEQQAELLLEHQIRKNRQLLQANTWYSDITCVRQIVIQDMCYNLGYEGLKSFKKMIKAIKKADYQQAADEIKNSKYYNQVGKRAESNCFAMRWDNIPVTV